LNGQDWLASWACAKLASIDKEEKESRDVINTLLATGKYTMDMLKAQWEDQKGFQLSSHSCM